jgi:hypothetical protein
MNINIYQEKYKKNWKGDLKKLTLERRSFGFNYTLRCQLISRYKRINFMYTLGQ